MREPPCAAHPPVPRAVRAGTGTATPCGPSQPERILKVEVDSKARAEDKSPHMAGRVGRREAGPGQRGIEWRRRIGDSEGSSGGEIEKRRRGQGGRGQCRRRSGPRWSKGRRMRVFEKVLVKRPTNVCSKASPSARCFRPKRRYLGFCGSRSKQGGDNRSSRHALAGVLTTIFPSTRTRGDIDQPPPLPPALPWPPALRLAALTPLTAALPCASRTLPAGGADTSGSLHRQRTSRLPAASCSMRSMSCWREWTPSFW